MMTTKKIATGLALILALSALPAMAAEGQVNINTASAEQLQMLPRVGPAIAERIVEYREAQGFEAPEDLLLVKGIGEKTFELLEDYVTVSGETTLAEKVSVPRKSAETSASS